MAGGTGAGADPARLGRVGPGTAPAPPGSAGSASAEALAALIDAAGRVCALTGAGISTDSGIGDFRGPDGLWTRNPSAARMFDLDAYRSDRAVRIAAWQHRYDSPIRTARPNAGHEVLARWQADRSVTIVTQNIDGLHHRAGSTDVVELHGTFWQAQCLDCRACQPIEEVLSHVASGEDDPACLSCGGLLRTATVAFGQSLDPDVWRAAVTAFRDCDVALVLGTSLSVQPAASLVAVAAAAGAAVVVVNEQPTGYDALAHLVIRGGISETLTMTADVLAARRD